MSTAPTTTGQPAPMTIDVISDVVCPWCFVGKRQLEQALERFKQAYPEQPAPTVRWHPFQLNPDLPSDGMGRDQYLQKKFGTADGGAIYDRVKQAADDVGLDLKLDDIERQPNTIRAHAVISLSTEQTQDAVVEALFEAYFRQGKDLTDDATLIEVAREGGIPEPAIEAAISDDSVHDTIRRADSSARDLGVQGVPFFIFNQKLAVSGAAGADTLMQAAEKVLAEPDEAPAQ
ncbi:MAG: DsbA family oxidoreductase [Burkholderiaceae bacterium]